MEQEGMMGGRTDLALEVRESFPEDDVEISGVVLTKENKCQGRIQVTTVKIVDEQGARRMGKPQGTYITLEMEPDERVELLRDGEFAEVLCKYLDNLIQKDASKTVLVVGLGNRLVTPDALGPLVLDELFVTRHLIREYGKEFQEKHAVASVCAIAPGVMAQTGMESMEILQGVLSVMKPSCVIAIDALAARSVKRLNATVQLTDTGISPGAGVGNNRKELNQITLGIPVIALGVPTVVDADTIVENRLSEALLKQGLSEQEIETFVASLHPDELKHMFVTPKDIDEAVKDMAEMIADGINACFCGNISRGDGI